MKTNDSRSPGDVRSVDTLLEIMATLRDPRTGCPWDRQQSFMTIAPYTIEEAYEVAEAISRNDMAALMDELGDLLFQVVFHAQMARESGSFDFGDVVGAIVDKMIRRHPHVFSDAPMESAKEQSVSWEAHKAAERRADGAGGKEPSLMDPVTDALPAVKRAQKLQQRAALAGFDWPSADAVAPKIEEELGELRRALESGAPPCRLRAELGDLMFSCVNLARHLDVDAEMALRGANTRFERRFRLMEEMLAAEGRKPADVDAETLEAFWQKAKRQVP